MDDVEPRDFGLAVQDAMRLDRCFSDLASLLSANPPIEGDSQYYHSNFSMHPRDEETIHEWNSRDLAFHLIRVEVIEGRLPVWLRMRESEVIADAQAFANVDQRTWRYGFYRGGLLRPNYLDGRPLWVKHADFASFIGRIRSRWTNPVHASASSVPISAQASSAWSEDEMVNAIAACQFSSREKAWRDHFKALQSVHGWDNGAFRHVWSRAKGSVGVKGRPPKTRGS